MGVRGFSCLGFRERWKVIFIHQHQQHALPAQPSRGEDEEGFFVFNDTIEVDL